MRCSRCLACQATTTGDCGAHGPRGFPGVVVPVGGPFFAPSLPPEPTAVPVGPFQLQPPPVCTGSGWPAVILGGGCSSAYEATCGVCGRPVRTAGPEGRAVTHAYDPVAAQPDPVAEEALPEGETGGGTDGE